MTAYIAPGLMDIDDVVSNEFMINRDDLYSKKRDRAIVEARQVAMYLRVKTQYMTLGQAAKRYNRDHATAIHAIKTVNDLMSTDRYFQIKANRVFKKLEIIECK